MENVTFGYEPYLKQTLRDLLKEELSTRQANNPKYSLRAFASQLGVNHSALSEVISGRRRLSAKAVESILDKLEIQKKNKLALLEAHSINPNAYQKISNDRIENADAWYFDSLLELTSVDGFKSDVGWVAQTLGVSEEKIKSTVEVLVSFGELKITKGQWRATETGTTTLGNRDKAKSIIKVFSQNLKRQDDSLKNNSPEKQCQVGFTIAASPEDLPEARRRIYEFQRELAMYLGRKNKGATEVYRFNAGLFPQTDIDDEGR